MKKQIIILLTIFFYISASAQKLDSITYNLSINNLWDLSDTYGNNGEMLSGELNISRDWYGIGICYGYFQSHSKLSYDITIESIGRTITVPVDEISIMRNTSGFLSIYPINGRYFTLSLYCGVSIGKSKSMYHNSISYSYDTENNEFIYLNIEYDHLQKSHFGMIMGIDLEFYPFKTIGMTLKTRIADMNHGGSFFFIGVGAQIRIQSD